MPDNHLLPVPLPRKANLGCGYDIREGYLNVDLHQRHNPDLVADVSELSMLPSGYFEEIVAQDVLEHLERHKTLPTLREWARLLQPNGTVEIRVPSLLDLFELLASPEWRPVNKTEELIHLMYGTQAYTGDYHLAGFTARTLADVLKRAGLQISRAELQHSWLYIVTARKTEWLADPMEIAHNAYFCVLDRPGDEGGVSGLAAMLARSEIDAAGAARLLAESDEGRFIRENPVYLRRFMTQLTVKPLPEPAPVVEASTAGVVSRIIRKIF